MPRCIEAQMPRYPEAQMPRSPDAQKPRCLEAQMPRCPEAQMPRCPDAQKPRCPDAQKPRCPDAQNFKKSMKSTLQNRILRQKSAIFGSTLRNEIDKILKISDPNVHFVENFLKYKENSKNNSKIVLLPDFSSFFSRKMEILTSQLWEMRRFLLKKKIFQKKSP